ncbi:MAG: hypothetical protein SGILL_002105 [Bacillariaceae sp.]
MSGLFMQYPEARFVSNLKNLKESIAKDKDATEFDEAAYLHDLKLFPRSEMSVRGYKRWDRSAAQKLLRKDVKLKRYLVPVKLKPQEFQKTRPEYLEFPLEIFRKHIYQEEYAQIGRSYWMAKKEAKKKKKAEAKKAGKKLSKKTNNK